MYPLQTYQYNSSIKKKTVQEPFNLNKIKIYNIFHSQIYKKIILKFKF